MNDNLDHIIWACRDLEYGSRRFETLTGVRPRFGGVHAGGLTHNALVAIGPRCYLEILAPTGPARPHEDPWCRLARAAEEPRVMTYCMRSSCPLSELALHSERHGWRDAVIAGNGRTTPEGAQLRWKWLAPKIDAFGTAFPFFIDWLDSPHPAVSLRTEHAEDRIQLQHFAVGHPDAARLREILSELGAPVETFVADAPRFRVELETPRGRVSLI
jgi:hypothetical protein